MNEVDLEPEQETPSLTSYSLLFSTGLFLWTVFTPREGFGSRFLPTVKADSVIFCLKKHHTEGLSF